MRVDHLWIYMYEVLQNRSRVSRERLSGLTRLSIVGCVNPFLKINPCFRSKSVWARFYTERNVSGYTVFRGFSWLEGRYYRSRVNRHFPTRELIYRFLRDRFEKNNTRVWWSGTQTVYTVGVIATSAILCSGSTDRKSNRYLRWNSF